MMTSRVATIIQATSPLLATGAGAADAAADAAGAASEAAAAGAAATAEAASGAEAACANEVPLKPRTARPRARVAMSFFMLVVSCVLASKRVLARLAGPDADHLLQRRHEDLAVTDLAGAGRGLDGFDHAVDECVVDG